MGIKIFFILILISLLPILITSECTCDKDSDDGNDKVEALKYKLIAIASILVAGAIGVSIPTLGRYFPALSPENDVFFLIKAFAAGVILATGMVHVLPDSFENLTSPCLPENPWGNFPFAGFVAMMSAMGTLMVDSLATSYFKNSHFNKETGGKINGDEEKVGEHEGHMHLHTHATHGHAHGPAPSSSIDDSSSSNLLRHRIISQVLEVGIIVHSVIIGISLGASLSPSTIKPLVAALTFHQMFEGMGLGSCISQAKFKSRAAILMSIFFSLTTPVGIVIGFGISNIYDDNSPTALIVEGIFNSASAGILIYMSLVDLLAADFMSTKLQNNLGLQFSSHFFLMLGAGCMSLLAKWA